MEKIGLNTFLSYEDKEIAQYHVLGGIKEYHTEFGKNKIYPALAELIVLKSSLEKILEDKSNLEKEFPKNIVNYDFLNKKVISEPKEEQNNHLKFLFDLVEWAIPFIKNEIEEGIVLFEFVEKSIRINHIGIIPLYKEEGYFMINNPKEEELQVHKYSCSLFYSEGEKYRALKTSLIEKREGGLIERSPESIKLDLIGQYKDLPNPATYLAYTEMEFPFNETVFPVAKRKLMASIAS